ncbi:ComF family protein [uncultured Thiothrix sp.]|jgi:predicted amidophosphoribosyltransferase|uniref:ComF family protein n=1 Tax=uncultured Thiothrix sp. TaxID=223185 RepID=UPI002614384B|nr:ComF family protein [uncultured Thiothrix sp.]HMT94311.1 ComF family protein [Thiolinea sp.]
MSIELKGNWKKGFAYDVHTLDSVYMGADEQGYDHWETTRSEMGELVYQLKYQGDTSVLAKIIDLLGIFKGLDTMQAIIPVPASKKRKIQPVHLIATALGNKLGIPVFLDAVEQQANGQELKNITDPNERKSMLRERIKWTKKYSFAGQNILLIDDLYRSGSTLKITTEVLYQQAKAKGVFVLTMTKTRKKR